MPLTLVVSAVSALRGWLRSIAPTREAIVTAGSLGVVFGLTYLAAFFTRSELLLRASDAATIVRTIGWVVLLKLLVFYTRGICHRPLRSIRFEDLSVLVRAATTCLLVLVAANHLFTAVRGEWIQIPRTVLLLDWAFTLLAVGGLQAASRSVYEELMPLEPIGHQRSALVIDASPHGQAIAAHLMSAKSAGYFVSGLLDDDPAHHGAQTAIARVIGGIDNVAACAQRLRVSDVVVRHGSVHGRRLRRIWEACAAIRVRVTIAEARGDGAGVDVRLRSVELSDLVTHTPPEDPGHGLAMASWVRGETILVTGAGGALGTEICRQLVDLRPAQILLVERAECSLFEIHRELVERIAAIEDASIGLTPCLIDIRDTEQLDDLFIEHRPGIVIHAAAYKHVPMLQAHPVQAIENNILATAGLADLAELHGVKTFVSLSTDKVVNPTGVMGASKLIAERFLQAVGENSTTKFVVVRFGNVIGSSGTAVPIFTQQLLRREPVTVTDPDVARRFMTPCVAARLVMLAGALAESSETCVLDSGEPVRLVELVKSLALVMRVPKEDVDIHYCGLRAGEKLSEEQFFDDETRRPAGDSGLVYVSRSVRPLSEVRQWLGDLKSAILSDGPDSARAVLMEIASLECMASSVGPTPPGDGDPRESRP